MNDCQKKEKVYGELLKYVQENIVHFNKWILGGALALLAVVLLNPSSMRSDYGPVHTKLIVIFLISSIIAGLIHLSKTYLNKEILGSKLVKESFGIDPNSSFPNVNLPDGTDKDLNRRVSVALKRVIRENHLLPYQLAFFVIPIVSMVISVLLS